VTPHWFSFIAVAVIVAGIVIAWRGRFLAAGTMIITNIVVHALVAFGPSYRVVGPGVVYRQSVVQWDLGIHPDELAAGDPWAFMQLVTHMFVHADVLHLLGNLIVLLAFALPFEERIKARLFTLLYLGTGLIGAIIQLVPLWGVSTLMIGASGAVFGIIGAFAGSYPNLVVPLPLPLGFILIWVRMRVILAALVFGAMQVLLQYVSNYVPGDNTAYLAHLGGLAGGLVLARVVVRPALRRGGREAPEGTAAGVAYGLAATLDLAALERFAVDDDGRRALAQMRANVDEPDVFEAWLERFLRAARSPDGAPLALRKGELVSTRDERFDVRKR
jgi:membrane associated rhomboid family serine protease